MPGEKTKKQVRLMGAPHVSGPLGEDADAVQLLALLVLAREFLPPEGVREGNKVRRDWLAATLHPGLPPEPAREKLRYTLDKLDKVLQFRRHSGARERGVVDVSLDGLRVDALEIVQAARQMHRPPQQDEIIALAERPLLDGMGYPWLEMPPFRQVRAELDGHYLAALARRADGFVAQMEQANARAAFDPAEAYRAQAIPLLDKATERLQDYGDRHPLAQTFSDLRTRTVYGTSGKAAPPLAAPPALRLPVTSFVGREAERAKIKALLATERLVTLTGMGGCGKTRLAWQTAAEMAASYPDGVWPVELAALVDPTLVPSAVATALGLAAEGDPTETVLSFLHTKRAVLLLDNCEHLLQPCAGLVQTLLQSCPDLRVLTTSRQPLNIDGEHLCRVRPLDYPDSAHLSAEQADPVAALQRYDAVRLFLDRVRPYQEFTLGTQNVASVAAICRDLDGIPLALELAAAQIKARSVAEIAEMLADRFALLTGGRRTALARHKTLRAVVDWSYDLLTEQEQALLCRVSVFAGGWTLDAVQSVGVAEGLTSADVPPLLTGLIDKSLVIKEDGEVFTRYRMLETVRQYAQDRLRERGEWDQTCRRHRDFYLSFAEAAQPRLFGEEQMAWLNRLHQEHDNLRAALAWRLEDGGEAEAGLRLCGALVRFWEVRGYLDEGRRWCMMALSAGRDLPPTERQAKVFSGVGILCLHSGDTTAARENLQHSLRLRRNIGDQRAIAVSLNNLGAAFRSGGDLAAAQSHHEEALPLFREVRDLGNIGLTCNNLGAVAWDRGNLHAAQASFEEGLNTLQEIGDTGNIAISLNNLGGLTRERGDLVAARSYYEQGLIISRDMGNQYLIALLLNGLGIVARTERDFAAAHAYYEEALAIRREIEDNAGIAYTLSNLACVTYDQGNLSMARLLFEQSLALSRQTVKWDITAGTLNNLGKLAREEGLLEVALAYHAESMRIYQDIGGRVGSINCLEGFAALALTKASAVGRDAARVPLLQRATRLWGVAGVLRERSGAALEHAERAEHERFVAEARERLTGNDFEAAWAEGQAMSWEQAVDLALERNPIGAA